MFDPIGAALGIAAGTFGPLVRRVRQAEGERHPLEVTYSQTVGVDDWWRLAFHEHLSAQERERLGALASNSADLYALLRQRDGVDYGHSVIRLRLKGRAYGTGVEVYNIYAHVALEHDPPTGTGVAFAPEGVTEPVWLLVDLDDEKRDLWAFSGPIYEPEKVGDAPYFRHGKRIKLTRDETFDLVILAIAKEKHYQWRLRIETLVGTRTVVVTVPDDAFPFQTTGGGDHESIDWHPWYGGEWDPFS